MAQLSPALAAKPSAGSEKIPQMSLTPSMAPPAKSKAPAPTANKPDVDVNPLAYGRVQSEPLLALEGVDAEKVRLMRNMLFAPTHKAYLKADLPIGPGRDMVPEDLNGTWSLLPWPLRDCTKAARPMLAWLHTFSASPCKRRIVLTLYDTETKLAQPRVFNTDEQHTLATLANLKRGLSTDGEWDYDLLDNPIKYMLAHPVLQKIDTSQSFFSNDVLEDFNANTVPLRVSILVLPCLTEPQKKVFLETKEDSIGGARGWLNALSAGTEYANLLSTIIRSRVKAAPPAKPKSKPKTLSKPADNTPAHAKKVDGPSNEGKRKKKEKSDSEDSDDNDSDDDASDDEPLSKRVKNVQVENVKQASIDPKGKRREEKASDDEQELSGSGSDSGTDDSEEDDSESEEDDSESEDAEDSEEEERNKSKNPASSPPKVGTLVAKRNEAANKDASNDDKPASKESAQPGLVQQVIPGASIAQNKKKSEKSEKSGHKGEKQKRRPALGRRQGTYTFAVGVLDQLDGLDDAVPEIHQKRLTDKVAAVRKSLAPYLNEGRVRHVKLFIEDQIALISELGSIISKVGVADGPKGPDAAASRQLAKQAAKLFAVQAPKINQLNNMIATWSGMVSEMNAAMQKASTEMSRTTTGLFSVAPDQMDTRA